MQSLGKCLFFFLNVYHLLVSGNLRGSGSGTDSFVTWVEKNRISFPFTFYLKLFVKSAGILLFSVSSPFKFLCICVFVELLVLLQLHVQNRNHQ